MYVLKIFSKTYYKHISKLEKKFKKKFWGESEKDNEEIWRLKKRFLKNTHNTVNARVISLEKKGENGR